ncbi:N-acetyl-1-D-myo-inositol-2-amino-2-deoxy-alpha-D-glucopyranoside deacetylase [Sediminihabitans luteus]|uniref:N-acetyl-1-D-myo-inositol-2-amino-2-deoxy-alpha-D-glucopyranoside deacetylase n=1 Tax=Sediminihabitans luteus TaxID=1138585 RepID=A0A2M9CYK3_9CELL|nr:PIG-L family deacetylase [Sediminihabitans luteus]PJJ77012.1 N-acetyl-1-D-myo-inositol-2-amino-2-deoxy-alpha-D-glucopyranoside deacetylase [Sediminihabitans luteus]GII99654.1 1D-myo-inositol 2-acetamido-2-deoxy-alpha-D-glucopyranoside deacetylase [Sediminihabitans luteus]
MRTETVQPSGGLVAVHAHPDDETLTSGALLATWAAAGEPVTVVTCTRGEQGEVIGARLAHLEGDGPALAAHRETELAGALAALGVRDHVFLDAVPAQDTAGDPGRFEDSGMSWLAPGIAASAARPAPGAFVGVPLDRAAARLAAVLRARRPAVVATYEPGGGYGHPDHVRTHEVVLRAVELARAADGPGTVGQVWCAVVPESLARSGRRALASAPPPAGRSLPDPDEPLPPVAVPDAVLGEMPGDVVVVPVAPVLDAVLAALRSHATQVQDVARWAGGSADHPASATDAAVATYALSNDVLAAVPPHEHYVRVEDLRDAPADAVGGGPGSDDVAAADRPRAR